MKFRYFSFLLCVIIALGFCTTQKAKRVLIPQIDGEWWYVTGNPMDHKFATERQEPVDFAVWQALRTIIVHF